MITDHENSQQFLKDFQRLKLKTFNDFRDKKKLND